MDMSKIRVEVAYALPDRQVIIVLEIEPNSTVQAAIQQSNILVQFPEIDLQQQKVGIFSKRCELTDVVHDGDRIEIYRPLIIDPKTARRKKAARK